MDNMMLRYRTQAVSPDLLSMLNVATDGKVVSAETWTTLWNTVLKRINNIDAYCVDIEATRIDWEKAKQDLRNTVNAIKQGFVHYGEEPPTNEDILFWVRPCAKQTPATIPDVYYDPNSLNAQSGKAVAKALEGNKTPVNQTYTPKSENAQSGTAVAEAINSTKKDIYNNVSNSLKSTKSGAVITADDVSPLEHSLKVKLTSDTVTDFSGVSVTRKGTNLFNPVENFDASNKAYVSLEDDVFTMSAHSAQVFINNAKTVVTPAGKYTITLFPLEDYNDFNAFIYFYNKDGGKTSISTGTIGVAFGTYSYTFTAYEDFILSIGGAYGHLYNGERKFRVMLEEGTVDNPKYSAFVEPQTVAANKYGTVRGLTSASPMTLYSDNDEVIIHCEYNKDINPLLQKKLEFWQPNTEYKVGNTVISFYWDEIRRVRYNVGMVCIKDHTAPSLDYPNIAEDFNECWEYDVLDAYYSYSAVTDDAYNKISDTYVTNETLVLKGAELSDEILKAISNDYHTAYYIDNNFTTRETFNATIGDINTNLAKVVNGGV